MTCHAARRIDEPRVGVAWVPSIDETYHAVTRHHMRPEAGAVSPIPTAWVAPEAQALTS